MGAHTGYPDLKQVTIDGEHFDQTVESVRFQLAPGQTYRLYRHPNYNTDPRYQTNLVTMDLVGNGEIQEVRDLSTQRAGIANKVSSARFMTPPKDVHDLNHGWIELYSRENFQGRRFLIDHELQCELKRPSTCTYEAIADYRDVVVNGKDFDNTVASIRFQLPPQQVYRLYRHPAFNTHPDYQKKRIQFDLVGTGKVEEIRKVSDRVMELQNRISSSQFIQQDVDRSTSGAVNRDGPQVGQTKVDFRWAMEERFGQDTNADGQIDVPNTYAYVHNLRRGQQVGQQMPVAQPTFSVTFTSTATSADAYHWHIVGPGFNQTFVRSTKTLQVNLEEGSYTVNLMVTIQKGDMVDQETVQKDILVNDIVFVALGDSFSSGEGNPENSSLRVGNGTHQNTLPQWADAGSAWDAGLAENTTHARAHRSTLAWPAQSALALERADPHSSVTFVFLAATGATVQKGMLGPHKGARPSSPGALLPQLEKASQILGSRQSDILTLSIGGNDVGFANVITSLLKARGRDPELARRAEAIKTGIWDGILWGRLWGGGGIGGDRKKVNVPGLARLPSLLNTFNHALRTTLNPKQIYILAYPDLTQYRNNGILSTCDHLGDDVLKVRFARKIDKKEARWARETFLSPVNQVIRNAAGRHGWTVIGDDHKTFAPHGYCGKAIYVPPLYPGSNLVSQNVYPIQSGSVPLLRKTENRWIRTAAESVIIQGVPQSEANGITPDTVESTGMFHPNEVGHQMLMHFLVTQIEKTQKRS